MIGLLRAVPLWIWAVGAVLAWGGLQKARATRAVSQVAAIELKQAQTRGEAFHAGVLEVNRRLIAQQEAANHAVQKTRRALADLAAAGVAAGGLRAYAASLAASAAACHPAAAAVGSAASAPGDVLADMLVRMEAHGRALAAEADRRGIAGGECEQRYDALMPDQQ